MNTLGHSIHITLFGASHAASVGCVLEGMPAGCPVDTESIAADLALRRPAPGIGTARHEPDVPVIEGLEDGYTAGKPIRFTFANTDVRSEDYVRDGRVPRPGHADYPAWCRYGDAYDFRGGGMFSGRMTAPLVAVGGMLRPILADMGIQVGSYMRRIGSVADEGVYTPEEIFRQSRTNPLRAMRSDIEEKMRAEILAAKAEGDSVGGAVRCVAAGIPAGLGEPFFDSLDGELARAVFAVPGIKAVSFGEGFAASSMRGSANNDGYRYGADGSVELTSNHAGGVLGGLADGAPLVMDAAFKPTPSISRQQTSINLDTHQNADLSVVGRHDPCIAPRGAIVLEAMTLFTLTDFLIRGGFAFQ